VIVSSSAHTGQVAMTSWTICLALPGTPGLPSLAWSSDAVRAHRDDVRPRPMLAVELEIEHSRVKHRDRLLPDAKVSVPLWQPMCEL
jgi:hypothetical protein